LKPPATGVPPAAAPPKKMAVKVPKPQSATSAVDPESLTVNPVDLTATEDEKLKEIIKLTEVDDPIIDSVVMQNNSEVGIDGK
jgi:hypothetical protein